MRRLLPLLLFSSLTFAQAPAKNNQVKELDVNNFSHGVDTYHDSTVLPDGYVQDALNIYFDRQAPVEKRQGYTVTFTSKTYSYSSAWTYTDGSNITWIIVRASDTLIASNLSGSVVKISTVSSNDSVDEANAFGNAYFVDPTQGVYYWNGTATTYIAGSPHGSIIAQFHSRVWVAGLAVPNGNQLYGSKFLDGTTWTTGLNPTDPVQLTIGLQDNFDNITALYPFLDTLYITKYTSIYALYGFDLTNFQVSVLTRECGCIDKYSIQSFNKGMIFVSLRGLEFYDGYNCNRISDPIKNKIDAAINISGFSQQSWVQQSQTDWQAGTLNQLSATASAPSLVLSTQAAFSNGDSTQANWDAGVLTNLDSTTTLNSLQLIGYRSSFLDQSNTNALVGNVALTYYNQPFTTSSQLTTQQITGADIFCYGTGSTIGTISLYDSGFSSSLVSTTFVASSCGSGGSWLHISFTPTTLASSTQYQLALTISNGGAIFGWGYANSGGTVGCAASVNYCPLGGSPTTSRYFLFKEYIQTGYNTTGSITSRIFDVGTSTNNYLWNWGSFTTTETDNGQSIVYETRVSSSTNGPWDTPVPVISGGNIASATKEFIQYIATMTTSNILVTPVLSNVTISTSRMEKSTGTFKSQIHNMGSVNSLGSFGVTETLNDGSIAFSICSSTNSDMHAPNSCASQTANSQINVTTGTTGNSLYVQWYASFTVTNATQTPTLNNGTVQWFSGSKAPFMASAVYDNRYWLAVTTSTADSANDAIIVLNIPGAYSLFDIHAGGLVVSKNNLYHTDSAASGNIYLDNQGYNDNGNAVNAYVRTRDINLGSWIVDTLFDSLWPAMVNNGNFNVKFSYALDKGQTDYTLATINQNEFSNLKFARIPFPMSAANPGIAQTVNFKIQAADLFEPFQFQGMSLLYHERQIQE